MINSTKMDYSGRPNMHIRNDEPLQTGRLINFRGTATEGNLNVSGNDWQFSTNWKFPKRSTNISIYDTVMNELEKLKPVYKFHPFFHYFGVQKLYNIDINNFENYQLGNNHTYQPLIHKYDEFVNRNFEDKPLKFESDNINLTISRNFNRSCYTNANNIDNFHINQPLDSFAGLLTGQGSYVEHSPIYYSYYQPILTDKNGEGVYLLIFGFRKASA